ncbi:MAG: class I SAM-dependent methyltransferase [Ignavibacteriaceae bacterium]|nr:class I SAM-dependent methyltransferase [Ignavibacteriaceae bacterium]
MHYDPIKDIFASILRKFPFLRVLFYKLLDLMFLRSWYVRRELLKIRNVFGNKEIAIYDAGSGYGQYTYFMTKHLMPCTVYSADIKEKWINDSREFFSKQRISNVDFAVEDLMNIEHKNRFDLVVCVDVMEHIQEDQKVFLNFYNALKKGGFMLINSPSIFGGSDVHGDEEESFISEHARDGYSNEDLELKLNPLGFSTYRSRYTYGFWGDKAWRLGIKYPMVMLNTSKAFFFLLPFYYLVTFLFTFIMMELDFLSKNRMGSGINFIAKK